jgi:hypothetical protein
MLVSVANCDKKSFDGKQLGTDRDDSKYAKVTLCTAVNRERKKVFLFLITDFTYPFLFSAPLVC